MSAYGAYKAAQDKSDRLDMLCDELDSAKFYAEMAGENDMSGKIVKLLDAAREKKEVIDGKLQELETAAQREYDEEMAWLNREYERSVKVPWNDREDADTIRSLANQHMGSV